MTSQPSGPDPRDELVEHLPALRAFAMSLTRSSAPADDLVQDTIVKAWTNMDKFQPGTNLRAWLFTILRNTFYSNQRKRRREVPDTDGIHAGRQMTRPEHDGRLALTDFQHAFEQLPDEQREALILVGALMMQGIRHIEWEKVSESVPAFLTIIMMPLTFSIANGVSLGIISYCVIKLATGEGRKVSWPLYLIGAFLLSRYLFFEG